MRTRIGLGGLALVAAASLAACDDDPTGLTPEELAGTWDATAASVSNPADPTQTLDLIALGMVFSLTLQADGSLSVSIDIGDGPDVDTGTYTIDGNEFGMLIQGDLVSGTIALAGNVLDVSLTSGIEWDFEDTGIDVPATLDLELVRS